MGGIFFLGSRTDVITDIVPLLLPETVARVWSDPDLRALGFRFALPTLFILLCHELGHYLVCRRHRLPVTPPYFVPAPIGLGTFGAFIRIRGPIRTRRQLIEVGVSGPIAGFVALLPFLVYGVAASRPVTLGALAAPGAHGLQLFLPGEGLLGAALVRLLHGPLPADVVLNPHPFLLAAWVGLFATMLNLLPLGQLDGGHVLYAVFGRNQPRVALPLWGALALAGMAWPGWWLWCVIVLVLGLRHPPLVDEAEPLDGRGRRLAVVAALIFAVAFMPVPIREVVLALP